MKGPSRTSSLLALLFGAATLVLFWILDVYFECKLFDPAQSCRALLLHPDPHRLWTRLIGSGVIVLLSLVSVYLLRRHEEIEAKLAHSGFLLKELTIELKQNNERLSQEITRRKAMEKDLETMAITDQLTGIYNRRKFDEILHMHIRQEIRYPKGLSLLAMDIDHFKGVNDRYGHSTGDEALKEFVRLVMESKRDADDFFRVGGEEFCMITFNRNGGSLEKAADKIREAVDDHAFPIVGHLTVSIGVTQFVPGDTYDSLFKRADDALYIAKEGGRNQVVVI